MQFKLSRLLRPGLPVCTVSAICIVLLFISASEQSTNGHKAQHPVSTFKDRNVVCTIASKNHLYRVRVFFRSVARHVPDAASHMLLVDEPQGYFNPANEPFTVLRLYDLATLSRSEIDAMLGRYTTIEANNNFKAAYLKYLVVNLQAAKVLCFDPDIFLFDSMSGIWNALDTHSIVTTPHALEPYPDDSSPNDHTMLRVGTLNLGFIGVNNSPPALKFLNWWHAKLYDLGYYNESIGLFSDQKWVDLVFTYFADSHMLLTSKKYNVAYWNLHERGQMISSQGRDVFMVGNDRLAFYHFSSWNPRVAIDKISVYGLRYDLNTLPNLKPIYLMYRSEVVDELQREDTTNWPYAFKH